MISSKSVYFLIPIFFVGITSRDLPSYFPRCYRDDPNLNECIIKAADMVRPYFKKGIPELNIPSISPLILPEIILQQGTPAVNYKASIKNLKIFGLEKYRMLNIALNLKNLTFTSIFVTDDIRLESDLDLDGKVLAIPLKGVGTWESQIRNVSSYSDCKLKFVEKRGLKFLEVDTIKIKMYIGEVVYARIHDLFENKELEDAIIRVVDDNMMMLVEELKPAIEEVLAEIVSNIMMNSFSRVSYDKLFPVGKH